MILNSIFYLNYIIIH